jgi:transposase InsO family protein
MSYQIVAEWRGRYAVETMCRALGVSASGYYAWCQRPASAHQQQDAELLSHIQAIHEGSRGLYGSPRIHAALEQQGIVCSRKRVARLMRQAGIHSLRAVRRRIRTTDSQHNRPVAPNRLQRNFSATAPNEKWVGDMLGIWTDEGYLYLAALLDTWSRRIVGWAMSAWRDEALVTAALRMALGRRVVGDNLIHHTDQGSQYTADDYLALLAADGITVSMSRKGDCYDNAMMESFFSTLRAECTERQRYRSRAEARASVFDFIEVFYNRQRLHSSLGYCCPADYEATERQEVLS